MTVTDAKLRELITVVFIDLYQFIALREDRGGPEIVNLTDISDGNYRLIWKLAGYDGIPERIDDKQVDGGEWQAYVDDELISAAKVALQKAWKSTQSTRCPTNLFESNLDVVNGIGMGSTKRENSYLKAVEALNKQEIKWRSAIRTQNTPKAAASPGYVVFIVPGEFDKCIALTKSQKTIRFEISGKARNTRAIWRAIVNQCVGSKVRRPTCHLSEAEIREALGRDVQDQRSTRTPINRFNKLWQEKTGDAALLLTLRHGTYELQAEVFVEADPEETIQRLRHRSAKKVD